jgi:LPS-assembly lipoprotein
MKFMLRTLRLPLLLAIAVVVVGCGFHLRRSAALPPSMQRVHLYVPSGGDLQRGLARAMETSGVKVEDHSGAGIAELKVPVAAFSTQTLTVSGTARVTEYSVHYHVEFSVTDQGGDPIVAHQAIDMSRDFSYDALNTIGSTTQTEELQRSLVTDMIQSILFRLQAAARHPAAAAAAVRAEAAAPAAASSTALPAPSSSSAIPGH